MHLTFRRSLVLDCSIAICTVCSQKQIVSYKFKFDFNSVAEFFKSIHKKTCRTVYTNG